MLLNPITLGWLSIALVIIGIVPYFYLIFRGKVKPHAFSWLVWTMVCAVSFSAEYIDKAGPGAWSTGVACFNCLAVTVIAFFKSEHSISRGDVISLICALLAVPIWYFTHDPLASVIIVTAIDTVGFYPRDVYIRDIENHRDKSTEQRLTNYKKNRNRLLSKHQIMRDVDQLRKDLLSFRTNLFKVLGVLVKNSFKIIKVGCV
jgi:hypothetical protein